VASATRARRRAGTTDLWIEIPGLIPKGTGIGDLGQGAPEEDGGEVRDAVDMA
jgi:hypothetical protein